MYNEGKEVREAISAGERALSSLQEAEQYLDSARTWGAVDIFGGNMFSGLMKHSKIEKASQAMDRAKYDLREFQRELNDVQNLQNMNINVGDFMTFADFFFDGLIVDFMVQSRINDARRQVKDAIRRVENILGQLRMQI